MTSFEWLIAGAGFLTGLLAMAVVLWLRSRTGRVDEPAQRAEPADDAERLQAIGRLAGGIAHDFNNLLATISGFADLAVGRLPAEHPARAEMDEIREASDRGARMVRKLLSFGRRQLLDQRVVVLDDLVGRTVASLGRLFHDRLRITAELDARDALVDLDPDRLEDALLNLALNARDAMPDGGRLVVRTRVIDPAPTDSRDARGEIRIEVEDDGPGMPPEVAARIFEPFFTTRARGAGTGLGLPSVHGWVMQSGGRIAVETAPGQGTRFVVHLPVADATAATPERIVVRPAPPPPGGLTILVTDDEDAVRRLAVTYLSDAGHLVLQACDGEAALEAHAANHGHVDLLVSDVIMPGMHGPEVVARLRSQQPNLPVVFVSGYATDILVGEGVPTNAPLVPKPFRSEQLLAAVNQAWSTSHGNDGGRAAR